MTAALRDRTGALSLPLLLILLATTLLGFGSWGVMRRWHHLAELQLRLDRCVGQRALDLARSLSRIEAGNRRIRQLRTAQAMATVARAPQALAPLLLLEARKQDLEVIRWRARQAEWLARRGCPDASGWPKPLPGMHWIRPPDDLLGPLPLQWQGASPLEVMLWSAPRAAAAVVRRKEPVTNEISPNAPRQPPWQATWTAPTALGRELRASLD